MKKTELSGVLFAILLIFSFLLETLAYIAVVAIAVSIIYGVILLTYRQYTSWYFSSRKFTTVKQSLDATIQNCNDLNAYIKELATERLHSYHYQDTGSAMLTDQSAWNHQRPEWSKYHEANNVYYCSRQICANAKVQPFKYVCKYFDIDCNEHTLSFYEELINLFSTIEQGRQSYLSERDDLFTSISDKVPKLIRRFSKKRLLEELDIKPFNIRRDYYPSYRFIYISAGGNSSLECSIVFNVPTLEKFVRYIADTIAKENSISIQRQLMTRNLREQIKSRDGYRCVQCGISVKEEPHLLLEIDHIIPVSKGGKTIPENLQTLCWRCNRQKGDKLI